jgi:response regulator RpfG family c-di-GMP phosphodiesterase
MNLNILWIDDDYKTQEDFISFAEQDGIDIYPFESHEEGMESLENKPNFYHGIILDAKVKKGKQDTVTNLEGLKASRDRLIEINKDFYLPFFIFTGQPDYISNEMFSQSYGDYYIKGDDNEKLIKDIIEACSKHDEAQAKKLHPEAFKPFEKGILTDGAKKLVIDIIQNIENKNFAKKNINSQRDLLEAIFKSLNNTIPCIPNVFFDTSKNNKPNLEKCVRFLEDRETDGNRLNKNIPQVIKSSFRKVKESGNEFSHLKDEDIVKYPFLSNSFLLFEILIWLPEFVEEHYPNYI